MKRDSMKFLIAGVGGQGTILAASILADVGLRLGYDVKKSDILGLAVRGGSVVSHVLWAEKVRSPVLGTREADVLISFEWLEGLRRLSFVSPQGLVLTNDHRIDPMSVSSGLSDYPKIAAIRERMAQAARRVVVISGTRTAVELGNVKTFNVVIMGSLARLLEGEADLWRSAVADQLPEKLQAVNLKAFDAGFAMPLPNPV
jgi:indolepyruvate ferredoxin oxidoreductase, beta subunit